MCGSDLFEDQAHNMACIIGSERITTQAQELISVGFDLPAFMTETTCAIGSVFRPQLFIGLTVKARSVCGVRYHHCASFAPY